MVTIPALQGVHADFKGVLEALEANVEVVATIAVDPNAWSSSSILSLYCWKPFLCQNDLAFPADMFQSPYFTFLFRFLIAMVNACGVIIALEAVISHIHRKFFDPISLPQPAERIRFSMGPGAQTLDSADAAKVGERPSVRVCLFIQIAEHTQCFLSIFS